MKTNEIFRIIKYNVNAMSFDIFNFYTQYAWNLNIYHCQKKVQFSNKAIAVSIVYVQ